MGNSTVPARPDPGPPFTATPGLGPPALHGNADPDGVIYVDNKEVGAFMRKRVFGPGRTLPWNDLTGFATGRSLEAKAFAAMPGRDEKRPAVRF